MRPIMKKYKYTKAEQEFNKVLKYQNNQLNSILFDNKDETQKLINDAEALLRKTDIKIPDHMAKMISKEKKVVSVKNWGSILEKADTLYPHDVDLQELFSQEEFQKNELYIRKLNSEFNQIHKLDEFDITIAALAGIVSGIVDIVMVGIPQKTSVGLKAAPLSNYVREYFEKAFPEEEMSKLANSKISKVPYDAQDNRNTAKYVEGLSAYYHRMLQLGHDPILGFVFGVLDILNGTMSTIDKKGAFIIQDMPCYEERKEATIFAALCKQILHLQSDITTSMSLPVPLMSLFNFLQIGKIGEYEQTIAEIVQGMYYEGYDFIHFCSMSIPVMITEVIIRLGYALKRIKEGHSIKESIPFSSNHQKHPKLGTMLFIGHSSATAINTGKLAFTENPLAINYPQWIMFAKNSYLQLKWVLKEKPELRDRYVRDKINEELLNAIECANTSFDEYFKDYIIVFE